VGSALASTAHEQTAAQGAEHPDRAGAGRVGSVEVVAPRAKDQQVGVASGPVRGAGSAARSCRRGSASRPKAAEVLPEGRGQHCWVHEAVGVHEALPNWVTRPPGGPG